ncbi:serine/threonine-protein kinase [Pseudarthrobacter sp. C4D7]|uniref:serine/threonine-protein kinase n=1 Tax=Pseudarthrobacter sp. C4D7 TaxID=2735268 RepID=UPI001585C875|nr:serine/threonine-protein kinase [Pseudarthrobacter sp. C4D7]NUT72953.1 serine/threonine protein kinase [Pseudarthrobacter sp. C4D7]
MDDAQAPEFPGYDVGRLLGRGSSADVWLATEQRTGRDYALKCFRTTGGRRRSTNTVTAEDVRREIRILSTLDHQHLVRAHHVVQAKDAGGGMALAMDYAAGGSLAQLVSARGRLGVGETVTVLTPIAQALAYLHGKGFTHSDVSPGNILFTRHGKPMLSDLGIARMLGDPGRAGSVGTGGFLDPAPVDAVRAGLQPERDVYSLAALGWYCLTGDTPGRTADRPPLSLLVPGVPKDLAAALEAGLSDERRLRPDASALATAVYRSAEPQPVDLSEAVHPAVMPELLTRRSEADAPAGHGVRGKLLGLRGKLLGLRRRAATSRWPAPAAAAASGGKHADGPGGWNVPGMLRRSVLPFIAAAAAVAWWLQANAGGSDGLAGTSRGVPPPSAPTVVAGGLPAAGGGSAASLDAARRQAGTADPVEAVRGLAALRDHAFSTGNTQLLAEVNAPGSSAAAADQRIAGQVAAPGQRLQGFTTALSGLAAEDGRTDARAVVRAVSATSGYRVVGADGAEVAAGAPTEPQLLRLVLVSVDGRWKLSDILQGP